MTFDILLFPISKEEYYQKYIIQQIFKKKTHNYIVMALYRPSEAPV
jgi:hypothetical protein